ncbi:hypothetical protein TrVFT333_002143 [Trichoderma virens FT-333]|nr:hypothetical protein TrVFT333_002143 [Trichoderma virens FT-333]
MNGSEEIAERVFTSLARSHSSPTTSSTNFRPTPHFKKLISYILATPAICISRKKALFIINVVELKSRDIFSSFPTKQSGLMWNEMNKKQCIWVNGLSTQDAKANFKVDFHDFYVRIEQSLVMLHPIHAR